MSQVRYEPLRPGRKEIRVVEILSPKIQNSLVECHLVTTSLLDDTRFTALSYVWGDPTVTKNIILDGCIIPVTINLANALSNVEYHWQQEYPDRDPGSFRLWIDAICINQKDVDERNQQVQLMRSIYSQAELVLSWLGSGDEEMCLAMRSLEIIAQEVNGVYDTEASMEWIEKYPSLYVQDTEHDDDNIGNKAWTAMWHFFELRYWSRIWIFQELVLGQNILLIYGAESLRYESLAAVCAWSRRIQNELYRFHRPLLMSNDAWRAATGPYIDWYKIENITLAKRKRNIPARRWNFLLICRHLLATDPKDHIYGLLAILEEGLEAKIIPDYRKNVGGVYCDAIGSWIEEEQDLTFLYLAGIGRFEYDQDLPSWTPNFSGASRTPSELYMTAGHADWGVFEKFPDEAAVSASILRINGLELDHITSIEESPKLETWKDGRMLQYCINFMSRTKVYATGIPPLQAIFHVLMVRYKDIEDAYSEEDPSEESALEENCPRTENPEEAPLARATGKEVTASMEAESEEERYYFLLALGFLKYVLFGPEMEIEPQNRFRLLGLSMGDDFPDSFEKVIYPECKFVQNGLPNLSTELTRTEGPVADAARTVMVSVIRYNDTYRFVETRGGYLGLAPDGAKVGDSICVLKGCRTPVLLRKIDDHFIHVGTCYVLGLMEGEAAEMLETGHVKVQGFEIH